MATASSRVFPNRNPNFSASSFFMAAPPIITATLSFKPSDSIADMLCHIYRSNRKVDTYLYLLDKDDFSVIPQDLLRVFGEPEFSFSFELTEDRELAKEDTGEVMENLENQGYHLQLQDDVLIEQMLAMKGLN